MSMEFRKKLSEDRKKALEEEALKKKNKEARQNELKNCARIIIKKAFEPMFQKVHDADRLALELSFCATFGYGDDKKSITVRFSDCKTKNPYLHNIYEFEGMGNFKPIELLNTVEDICEGEFCFFAVHSIETESRNSCYFKIALEP
ncbi:MAG: hypothetical protein HFJ50_04035 [Clostridia bacterium]|jgi:hypothetical protein|nr:hypothetical protein [Clostridia bacterium]